MNPLEARPTQEERELTPARILNEYTFCPRLAHLEWVQGEWADSSDTVEGRHQHRRVDVAGPLLPAPDDIAPDEPPPAIHARSVTLSALRQGSSQGWTWWKRMGEWPRRLTTSMARGQTSQPGFGRQTASRLVFLVLMLIRKRAILI